MEAVAGFTFYFLPEKHFGELCFCLEQGLSTVAVTGFTFYILPKSFLEKSDPVHNMGYQ